MPRKFKKSKVSICVFCEGESEQAYTDFLKSKFCDVAVFKRPSSPGLFDDADNRFKKDPGYRNYQTKAGKAHDFNRGMKGRTLELLWEKFQNNFVYIHVFVTTWHLKYDIIDT